MRLYFSIFIATWIALYYLYPYHFALPYFDTDFVDYCVGISTFEDLERHFPPKRSRVAGFLPYVLSKPFGILNGLAWASSITMLLIALLLVQWSNSIKKDSGWYTLAVLLACSPWIGTGRYLTFYPMILLLLTIGTTLVWYIVHTSHTIPVIAQGFILGSGIGLCLIADARGLIWAGWLLIIAILWSSFRPSLVLKLKSFIGLIGSLFGFWLLGTVAYGPHSVSLIRQLDIRPLRHALSLNDSSPPPFTLPTEFVWGWEYGGLIEGLQFVLGQQMLSIESSTPDRYWLIWLIIIGTSMVFTMRKHWLPWLLLVPFFIAYLQIGHAVESHVRFYMHSLPPLAVGIGLALHHGSEGFFKNYNVWKRAGLLVLLPYLSISLGHHWTIEREISHKMLTQAHPSNPSLENQRFRFGTPLHIQVLPVTYIERTITQDWDTVCTEALAEKPPTVWFD